jgi:hypothetical protein
MERRVRVRGRAVQVAGMRRIQRDAENFVQNCVGVSLDSAIA